MLSDTETVVDMITDEIDNEADDEPDKDSDEEPDVLREDVLDRLDTLIKGELRISCNESEP